MAQGTNINGVIQEIALGNGPITKAEYDKFWKELGMTKPEEKQVVIAAMRKNLMMSQEYQKEIWKCAEQAWLSRAVPKCPAAKAKFDLMKAEMQKVNQEEALKTIQENSDNLLKSAAAHTSVKGSKTSPSLPLNLETIQATEKSMDRMLSRFEQVLRVQY